VTPSSQQIGLATTNLTQASFLVHKGLEYSLVRREGDTAAWVFADPKAQELSQEFTEGKAKVEPQSFHHSITGTRRLLFSFLKSKAEEWGKKELEQAA
jgi:hypothetical protein